MFRFVRRGSQLIQIAVFGLFTAACSSTARPILKMSPEAIEDKAFRLEPAYIVSVNVPFEAVEKVLRNITDSFPLGYGKYDQVAFRSSTGVEQFRPLRGSRAGEQAALSEVPTTRITFAIRKMLIPCTRLSLQFGMPIHTRNLSSMWRPDG
jgi:hypothetical protein